MRRIALALLTLATGCSGDGEKAEDDRVARKCEEYNRALCSNYVACRVVSSSGTLVTEDVCERVLPGIVAECARDLGDEIEAVSDEDFDACTAARATLSCELLCDRIPEDPPECLALPGYEPASELVTCAP